MEAAIAQEPSLCALALEELFVGDVAEDFDEVFGFAEFRDALELLVFRVLEDVDVAESADEDTDLGAVDGVSLLVAAGSASLGVVFDVCPILNQIDYAISPPFFLFCGFSKVSTLKRTASLTNSAMVPYVPSLPISCSTRSMR